MLSQELIIELKQILEEDFGVFLSITDTIESGSAFLTYFELLARVDCLKERKKDG